MRKIMMTLAAVSALAVAAPASAQYGGGNFTSRIDQLQANLQAGVQSGRITRNEAQPLRQQIRALSELERQFSRDGLSRGERDQLQQRVQMLRQQIRTAERNGDNRGRYNDDDDREYGSRRDCPPGLARRDNGCVPPGQVGREGSRYDRNWQGVPSQWGNQYRDDNRFMYRYDGNRIYQIDRRTGNVVRVIERR
jgi:hypothetical protein